MFNVQCSMFNVQCSMFNVQCSMLKKCPKTISLIILLFFSFLAISCGGGGGGVSAARGGNNAGKTGFGSSGTKSGNSSIYSGSGSFSVGTSGSGGENGENSPFFKTFPELDGIESIDISIVVNGTTFEFKGLTQNSVINEMPEIKYGDKISAKAVLNMADGETRETSIAEQSVLGDLSLKFATPYKLTYDISSAVPNAYGIVPADTELSSVTAPSSGFYSSQGCNLADIEIPGYRIEKWVLPDGTKFVPGSTKGDVAISPVFTIDYAAETLPKCPNYPITSQKDFTDLLTHHADEDFNGKTITLQTNVTANTSIKEFKGTFDGNNKTVTLNNPSTPDTLTGSTSIFFGLIGRNIGTVKDTKFAGSISSSGNGTGYAGAACGMNETGGTVKNCSSSANVLGSARFSGGLVGCNNGTISECYSTGSVYCSSSFQPMAGGICGWNYGTVEHCYSTGSIGGIDYTNVGGIAGCVGASGSPSLISYCYSMASIPASARCGKIAGYVYDYADTQVQLTNLYNTPPMTGSTLSYITSIGTKTLQEFISDNPSIWGGSVTAPKLLNTP